MPAKPRWLLAIPDAISQLEQLDRTLLTRRDVERRVEGQGGEAAELVGKPEALPRTKLLQQLKKHYLGRAPFRVEEGRRARLVARRDHELKLADLPDGGCRSSAGRSRCGLTSGVVASSAAISLPRVNRRRGPPGAPP